MNKKVKEETKVSDANYSDDFMQVGDPYKTGVRYLDQQLADLGAEAKDHYAMDLAEEDEKEMTPEEEVKEAFKHKGNTPVSKIVERLITLGK